MHNRGRSPILPKHKHSAYASIPTQQRAHPRRCLRCTWADFKNPCSHSASTDSVPRSKSTKQPGNLLLHLRLLARHNIGRWPKPVCPLMVRNIPRNNNRPQRPTFNMAPRRTLTSNPVAILVHKTHQNTTFQETETETTPRIKQARRQNIKHTTGKNAKNLISLYIIILFGGHLADHQMQKGHDKQCQGKMRHRQRPIPGHSHGL